jgi:cell division septum initiation protein DivIVA
LGGPHNPARQGGFDDDRHQEPRPGAQRDSLAHLSGDTMTNDSDLIPDMGQEDAFEVQMRGYSRRQVDEFVARTRSQIRDLEERLSRSLDETERARLELSAARQDLTDKPAHEEISERVGQILKLAEDEAKAQRGRAQDEISKQRDDAKKEAERHRTEAREQTERMLTAAQEQAENAIAAARSEAEKLRNSARIESERAIGDATKEAESAIASAKAQAKQMLDEATMRATAIHDGAERRLNLLTSRHTETMRRLTEIRDVVTNLVASETARGSLEDEVTKSVASSVGGGGTAAAAQAARAGAADGARRAQGGPQLPGRGGRDSTAVPDAARATAARTAQRADDDKEELSSRGGATTEDRTGASTQRSTPATGGAHASGARGNSRSE